MKIINGDCLVEMKKLTDKSVDLTVTSPPYDNLRTYNGNITLWGEHVWKGVLSEIFRVTKQGGLVVWVVSDETKEWSETGTSFKQALFAKEIWFNLHDTMIWEKQTFTATWALKTRYAQVFEYMFIFSKGKVWTFNPIKDRTNKSAGRSKKHWWVRQADWTTKPISSPHKSISTVWQRFNVWHMNTEVSNKNRCHPAQFPETLAHDHIISWSNPGDTILDPFMGSGTTGKMAKLLGRDFIWIELDPEYCKIAEARINAA